MLEWVRIDSMQYHRLQKVIGRLHVIPLQSDTWTKCFHLMVTVKQCITMTNGGLHWLLWVTVGYDASSSILEIIGLHETDLGMEVSSSQGDKEVHTIWR